MPKRLYLGNLPFNATEQDVRGFLAPQKVIAVDFINDRQTGRPRGFGFAEIEDDGNIDKVIADLNGMSLGGRNITVSLAHDRPQRSSGGGGRREGGGRGGNGHQRRRRDDDHDGGWHG